MPQSPRASLVEMTLSHYTSCAAALTAYGLQKPLIDALSAGEVNGVARRYRNSFAGKTQEDSDCLSQHISLFLFHAAIERADACQKIWEVAHYMAQQLQNFQPYHWGDRLNAHIDAPRHEKPAKTPALQFTDAAELYKAVAVRAKEWCLGIRRCLGLAGEEECTIAAVEAIPPKDAHNIEAEDADPFAVMMYNCETIIIKSVEQVEAYLTLLAARKNIGTAKDADHMDEHIIQQIIDLSQHIEETIVWRQTYMAPTLGPPWCSP